MDPFLTLVQYAQEQGAQDPLIHPRNPINPIGNPIENPDNRLEQGFGPQQAHIHPNLCDEYTSATQLEIGTIKSERVILTVVYTLLLVACLWNCYAYLYK